MNHLKQGRKFGRTSKQRSALLRALATSLIEHGRIQTTISKAKDLRPFVEKIITLGKCKTLQNIRLAKKSVYTDKAISRLFEEIGDKCKSRNGGYTRIMRHGHRKGDGATRAIIEIIDVSTLSPASQTTKNKGTEQDSLPGKHEPESQPQT